jgi:hypothetical protein
MLTTNARRALNPYRGDVSAVVDAVVAIAAGGGSSVEIINDRDPDVANVWRALRSAWEELADICDGPIDDCDKWAVEHDLVHGPGAAEFRARMQTDREFFDVRRAACWIILACTSITPVGSLVPADGPVLKLAGSCGGHVPLSRGHTRYGCGIHRRPHSGLILPPGMPPWFDACFRHREFLRDWFHYLADRLRYVAVWCGPWQDLGSSESTTTLLGTVGIFYDPPYGGATGRTPGLYGADSLAMAAEIRARCRQQGANPRFRIVLAGIGDEHDELLAYGWRKYRWHKHPGMGGRSREGKARARAEYLWASPHCFHDAVAPSFAVRR